MNFQRREFLKFLGYSSLSPVVASLSGCGSVTKTNYNFPFQPIAPSAADKLILADGFKYEVLISWQDSLNKRGELFGFNNDYTAFLPLPSINKNEKEQAILWVNHESINPVFVGGYKGKTGQEKTKDQLTAERKNIGGSLVKIEKISKKGRWKVVPNDPLNRRVDALTAIPFYPPQKIEGKSSALGTLANCAGGVTPWGTVLTCEENYQDYYGESIYVDGQKKHKSKNNKFSWEYIDPRPPEHYGWVVEVNPLTGDCKKHINLGRFSHECATTVKDKKGRPVVYMGDDANDQCIYKFVGLRPGHLSEGTLYVANTKMGKWLELSWYKNKILKSNFKSQQDVLIQCRKAAKLIGGTPQNRPEDIEIHPQTGEVYVALTNNKPKGNYHGSLLKISESEEDHSSESFVATDFLLGGEKTGFSCPDNLLFDKKGNLWLTNDISGKSMNKSVYKEFKNNGLFYIPVSGSKAGQVMQVASAPTDAEFTGLSFSDDYKTLFISVQHPGELSSGLDNLRSHWPLNDNKSIPKPSVVTIQGEALDLLMS